MDIGTGTTGATILAHHCHLKESASAWKCFLRLHVLWGQDYSMLCYGKRQWKSSLFSDKTMSQLVCLGGAACQILLQVPTVKKKPVKPGIHEHHKKTVPVMARGRISSQGMDALHMIPLIQRLMLKIYSTEGNMFLSRQCVPPVNVRIPCRTLLGHIVHLLPKHGCIDVCMCLTCLPAVHTRLH